MPAKNSWLIKRETDELTIVVGATYIPRQETWSMTCKVNGELTDACLSDAPIIEAQRMISAAVMEHDDTLTVTVKKEVEAA